MRKHFQELVHDFHVGIGGQKADAKLRISLIQEEANEFFEAVEEENIVSAIDAICDLLYVIYGTADVYNVSISQRLQGDLSSGDPEWDLVRKDLTYFKKTLEWTLMTIETSDSPESKIGLRIELDRLNSEVWEMANNLRVKIEPFFLEVHRTNMHKLTGPKREDGKQLKPPGWKPPRISALYDRLQAGNKPDCRKEMKCEVTQCQPHPEGGMICGGCGGLIVD